MLQIALVAATVIVASGSTSGIASYFLKVMPKGNKNISIYVSYIECPESLGPRNGDKQNNFNNGGLELSCMSGSA